MKTFATLTVAGVTGIVLLKLLSVLVVPLMGLFLGLLALTMKIALICAVGFFVYSLFRRRREERAA